MTRLRRASRTDRGALLVELAIVGPLLILLAVGVFEFGLAWRDDLTVANAGRAGVRAAAGAGDHRLADYDALKAIEGAIAEIENTRIEHVVIYESTTAGGGPSATCAAGNPSSTVGSRCNVYTADQMATLTISDFVGTTDCSTAPDRFYCPVTDRETDFDVGPGHLGVHLQVRRDYITGIFPGSITITDHSVMRLEPEFS